MLLLSGRQHCQEDAQSTYVSTNICINTFACIYGYLCACIYMYTCVCMCILLLCRKPGIISASAEHAPGPHLKRPLVFCTTNMVRMLWPSCVQTGFILAENTHMKNRGREEIWKNGNKMLFGRTGICMVGTLLGPPDCFLNLLIFFSLNCCYFSTKFEPGPY